MATEETTQYPPPPTTATTAIPETEAADLDALTTMARADSPSSPSASPAPSPSPPTPAVENHVPLPTFEPAFEAATAPYVLPVPACAVKVLPRWADSDHILRWRLKYRSHQPDTDDFDRQGFDGAVDDGFDWREMELQSFTRELPLVCLSPNLAYYFKVALETPLGWSDWSPIQTCVPPAPSLPGKCAAVLPTVQNATSVLLRWTPPIDVAGTMGVGEILRYRILVSSLHSEREEIIEGKADNHCITGLDCLTDYYFQVAGENCTGWGEYSDPSPAVQVPPPVPPQLQQPTVRRATHHTVVIQWQHPQATGTPVDSFNFRYTTDPAFPEGVVADPEKYFVEITEVPSNASQFVIQGLHPGLQYLFQVRAINRYGKGIWSESALPIKTPDGQAPSKILNLSAPNLYRSFITLQWDPAEENGYAVTEHILRQATQEDMSDAQETTPAVVRKRTVDQCELKHLRKAVYWFQMAAINELGMSEWSDPCRVDLTNIGQ
mmetsp:Transcript_59963/g.126953  ORF Transcript_59963/g.126953 Transcript_59963/m.126953 type:complete len:493 (+) Transcript_59963:78-1556(+)